MSKFERMVDGETYHLDWENYYLRYACCDCGMVHRIDFGVDGETLYFKSGKTLVYDHVWKDGTTIYIVVKGKKFGIGYNENKINMEKSFPGGALSEITSEQTEQRYSEEIDISETQQSEMEHSNLKDSVSLLQGCDDLFPIKDFDRDSFSRKVDNCLSGNPYFINTQEKVNQIFKKNLPGLWKHVFQGKIRWGGRLNADQMKFWNKQKQAYYANVYNSEVQRKKDRIEQREFLMHEFEKRKFEYEARKKEEGTRKKEEKMYPAIR